MSETDYHRMVQRTKNVAGGYSLSNVIKAEPTMDRLLLLFESQLDKLIAADEAVELNKWINYLAFDIVGEVTFSRSFGFLAEGKDIGNSISNQYKLRLYVCIVGHFNWAHDYLLANPLIAYLKLQPSMHIFDITVEAVKAASEKDKDRKDMIEQWKQQYANHPDKMAENEILAAAVANMGAGADTVSTILQGFFYYLLRDPESLKMLQEEIDHAQLSTVPQYHEARELPVLNACIKEAYRFHPPVGFGIPRVSPSPNGVTVSGRHFPPGVILSVHSWVIHRTKSIFGSDAEIWNARRWLGDKEKVAEMDKCLIAFGSGYATCPGKSLAHLEIVKTTALVVRDYEWEQVEFGKEWSFETYFTAVPYGWPVKMRRRQKSA
jgi:hypothetical protein